MRTAQSLTVACLPASTAATTSTTTTTTIGSNRPSFDLDPAAMEKRYRLLQWQLHPDKSAGKTPQEQQYSADQATRVNQAYGVLRQPLARANYMVSREEGGARSFRSSSRSTHYGCVHPP
jgi:curved DNA-binding protein CbpA